MRDVIEYSNGEIAIIWKPEYCIHSGICCALLPNVYRVDKRPWIDPMAASSDEIIEQVSKCPSGALSYRVIDE
jgi:uncharacterized Fe-S cluster protein YjdI